MNYYTLSQQVCSVCFNETAAEEQSDHTVSVHHSC